jgi:hypothetical protein
MWSLTRSSWAKVAALVLSFGTAYAGLEPAARAQTPDSEAYDAPAVDDSADMDPAALSQFREPLSPYGTWTDDPTYGTVWTPSSAAVGADFTPYVSGGHWALGADNQWTWASDYSWGWAPFHYGRWVWAANHWAWIPGRQYAPAWVTWRTGVDNEPYVGWSPMPPRWGWRGGVAMRLPVAVAPRYVYVPSRYAFHPGLRGYIAPPARVAAIAPRMHPYVTARPGVRYEARVVTRGPNVHDAQIPAREVPVRRAAPPERTYEHPQVHAPTARAYGHAQVNHGGQHEDNRGGEHGGAHR